MTAPLSVVFQEPVFPPPLPEGVAAVTYFPHSGSDLCETYTGRILFEDSKHIRIDVAGRMTFPKKDCVIRRGGS